MDKALKNSTPGKVGYILRIERFQIDTKKFKRTHDDDDDTFIKVSKL